MYLEILPDFFMGAAVLKPLMAEGSCWITSARVQHTSCSPCQLSKGQDAGEWGEGCSDPGSLLYWRLWQEAHKSQLMETSWSQSSQPAELLATNLRSGQKFIVFPTPSTSSFIFNHRSQNFPWREKYFLTSSGSKDHEASEQTEA